MDWLVSPSRATKSPVRQDMEMVRVVDSGTSHAINVMGDGFVVNVEKGVICEYFHNAWRERSLGALI